MSLQQYNTPNTLETPVGPDVSATVTAILTCRDAFCIDDNVSHPTRSESCSETLIIIIIIIIVSRRPWSVYRPEGKSYDCAREQQPNLKMICYGLKAQRHHVKKNNDMLFGARLISTIGVRHQKGGSVFESLADYDFNALSN